MLREFFLEESCPAGWTRYQTSCYKVVNEKILWHAAKVRCQQHGGSLIAINDADEFNFILSMTSQLTGDYAVWIGLHRDSAGAFSRWDNGEPLTFTQWTRNEPNNLLGNEDCVEMFRYSGGWLDNTCTGYYARTHPFICEIGEFWQLYFQIFLIMVSQATGSATKQLYHAHREGSKQRLPLIICGCKVFTSQSNKADLELKAAMSK